MFFCMHLYSKLEGGLYILKMATTIHLFSEGKKDNTKCGDLFVNFIRIGTVTSGWYLVRYSSS